MSPNLKIKRQTTAFHSQTIITTTKKHLFKATSQTNPFSKHTLNHKTIYGYGSKSNLMKWVTRILKNKAFLVTKHTLNKKQNFGY